MTRRETSIAIYEDIIYQQSTLHSRPSLTLPHNFQFPVSVRQAQSGETLSHISPSSIFVLHTSTMGGTGLVYDERYVVCGAG